jgi:hypothetical protein
LDVPSIREDGGRIVCWGKGHRLVGARLRLTLSSFLPHPGGGCLTRLPSLDGRGRGRVSFPPSPLTCHTDWVCRALRYAVTQLLRMRPAWGRWALAHRGGSQTRPYAVGWVPSSLSPLTCGTEWAGSALRYAATQLLRTRLWRGCALKPCRLESGRLTVGTLKCKRGKER